jgi:type II restriction enzyme
MVLDMTRDAGEGYTSACQIARRISENWGKSNLFCAACNNDSVSPTTANTKAVDFICPKCASGYQLKAGRRWNEHRVPDAAYSAMMDAIASDKVPNLLVLQYTPEWRVHNLMLIPSFLFSASAVQKRKPLSPTAKRAGWVGCDILLSAMPEVGKLRIVNRGHVVASSVVRHQYEQLRPLVRVTPRLRGWTLDVLRTVQSLGRSEFTLADIYEYDERLGVLHPDNKNIRPKIRQQLQVLRDLGLVLFRGNGLYRILL